MKVTQERLLRIYGRLNTMACHAYGVGNVTLGQRIDKAMSYVDSLLFVRFGFDTWEATNSGLIGLVSEAWIPASPMLKRSDIHPSIVSSRN